MPAPKPATRRPRRPPPDALIGTTQAAAVAGVARNTVDYWIATGKITPVYRTGHGWRFKARALYAYLDGRRAGLDAGRTERLTAKQNSRRSNA